MQIQPNYMGKPEFQTNLSQKLSFLRLRLLLIRPLLLLIVNPSIRLHLLARIRPPVVDLSTRAFVRC